MSKEVRGIIVEKGGKRKGRGRKQSMKTPTVRRKCGGEGKVIMEEKAGWTKDRSDVTEETRPY